MACNGDSVLGSKPLDRADRYTPYLRGLFFVSGALCIRVEESQTWPCAVSNGRRQQRCSSTSVLGGTVQSLLQQNQGFFEAITYFVGGCNQ